MTDVLTRTHYDVLAVAPGASDDEVRFAYRRLARVLHPDRHTGSPAGETAALRAAMAEVNEAWAVLSDPGRRAAYDASLGLAACGRPSPAQPVRRWLVDGAEPPRRLLALLGAAAVLGLVAAASTTPVLRRQSPASHDRDEPTTSTSAPAPSTTAPPRPTTTAPAPTTTTSTAAPATSTPTTPAPTTTTTAPLVSVDVTGCPSASVTPVPVTVAPPCPQLP